MTRINDTGDKFFTNVVDTAEQFIAGIINIREYLHEFLKKFKTVLLEYLGARGTQIHEKNMKLKISCQTPFNSYSMIVDPWIAAWYEIKRDGNKEDTVLPS